MSFQLRAGYLLQAIRDHFGYERNSFPRQVLRHLTAFNLDLQSPIGSSKIEDPILAVADNLVTRGMPTLPSLRVEQAVAEATGLTTEKRVNGSIEFPFSEEPDNAGQRLLREALLPIDPSLSPDEVTSDLREQLGSDAEIDFLRSGVSAAVGGWAAQLFNPQRRLDTIVSEENALGFTRQSVDFAVQLPVHSDHPDGLVVEIDGKQHEEAGQVRLDEKRDGACKQAGWTYGRTPATNAATPSRQVQTEIGAYLDHPCAKVLRQNFESPPWQSESGAKWTLAALIPLQVARIQKTLLYLVQQSLLDLGSPTWTIAVVERDIPGTRLAIQDFRELLCALFQLEGKGRTPPDINLRVYRSSAHQELEVTVGENPEEGPFAYDTHLGANPSEAKSFDAEVILDTSILLRPGLRTPTKQLAEQIGTKAISATIRTAHAPVVEPSVMDGRPIHYDLPEPMGDQDAGDEEAEERPQLRPLLYFLRNLFRKETYRPNQTDILCESLRGRDVIGLLPTGAGKSLTYQLSALLQPGIALVVAPLKSLMHDQFANLRRAGIESVEFIDSSLSTRERQNAQRRLREGKRQFVFISPERLQIQAFRDHLQSMKVPVTYCVVDEAHCVSEWGHDFRTAYLRLGPNARQYCETRWEQLPIIALTGTASFDVLADVRRELGFGEETKTVTPESMEREELKFEIVHVPPPDLEADADEWDIKKAVFQQKKQALPSVLREMPTWFRENAREGKSSREGEADGGQPGSQGAVGDEQRSPSGQADSPEDELSSDRHQVSDSQSSRNVSSEGNGSPKDYQSFFDTEGPKTNSGLIFTPHANGNLGVEELSNRVRSGLQKLRGKVGTFASSNQDQTDEELGETQEAYKENDLSALVATKAFGMGIDKPNIRYVVHMNMSQSIESYYQEAGRAGRDGDPARCVILYCDKEIPRVDNQESTSGVSSSGSVSVDRELLLFFHNNSFKGPEKEKSIVEDLLTGDARPDGESPDIQAVIRQMNPGESPQTVAIDFKNSGLIGEISEHLQSKADSGFTQRVVARACDKARSEEGLVKKLKWAYKQYHDEWPTWGALDGHEDWIASRFQRLRDEQDTFRAVYRLSTVGAIRDYTVDYNSNVIRALIQNLGDNGFIRELQNYISRYVAPEQAREIPDEVRARERPTTVQKCLDYLIDFVYDSIARKRKAALRTMEEAVQEGIRNGDKAFRRRVNTYFDSRYLPVLQPRIQDRTFSLDLVWEFIDDVGGIDDNVNHLRGACDRLLGEYTENGALYLLRAYTRCLADGGQYEAFQSDLREGWRLFREIKDLGWQEYLEAIEKYREKLVEQDSRLKGPLDEEIAHVHAGWLEAFNEEFLQGYPGASTS